MKPVQSTPLKSDDLPPTVRNRRGRKSLLERGSATLSHAAQYLMSEASQVQETPRPIDPEALAILFEAGRKLYRMERRLPSREIMASWLQTIAYMRAGLEKPAEG
jgi:hypothetical protein